jgi:hypothetical protein
MSVGHGATLNRQLSHFYYQGLKQKTSFGPSKNGFELSKDSFEPSKNGFELSKDNFEPSKNGFDLSRNNFEP